MTGQKISIRRPTPRRSASTPCRTPRSPAVTPEPGAWPACAARWRKSSFSGGECVELAYLGAIRQQDFPEDQFGR
ncbi:MAG: DUF397 domain-containing protein [Labedaea sp.]